MIGLTPQQILRQELSKVNSNQELIDLAMSSININQDVINFSYKGTEVLFNSKLGSILELDCDSNYDFVDLLKNVADNNKDKITVVKAGQGSDLTVDCVRYLYFSSINVYYKIKVFRINYSYALTKDSYKRYQEFHFSYLTFFALAWDDDNGLIVYDIKPSTAKGAELFTTEVELLNKYPNALIMS